MSSRAWPVIALALALATFASSADARPNRRLATMPGHPISQHVAFMGYLRDGRVATVYTDAHVTIAPQHIPLPADPRQRGAALRQRIADQRSGRLAKAVLQLPADRYGPLDGEVPPSVRNQILFDLQRSTQRYVPGRVIVVFKPGVTVTQDHAALAPAAATALVRGVLAKRRDLTPHAFTGDARTNLTLMQLGVDRADRLFAGVDRGTLGAMRGRAEGRTRRSLMPFENAFALHAGASSVENAVRTLRASSSVAYVSPDYIVSSTIAEHRPIPAEIGREIAGYRRQPKTFGRATRSTSMHGVPSNSAVSFGIQAMLNAPGVDAIAAFDEIGQRWSQLPGAGEIITNVGLGDVYDASAGANPNDPCYSIAQGFGPTTHLIGGQRYLDWPSMPLIPAWVSDGSGSVSQTAEVCGVDPQLFEVGLDFSVMAPLPHDQQRPGEIAGLGTDLLGIAPGASYRWVAPGASNGGVATTDTLAAMLAAARQVPAPNVMTVSIGFGADVFGFPGRYLEDDPIAQAVVAGIVASNVVVCIAANDGTRLVTAAAVGPSGGSAPTNVATTGFSALDDVYLTTVPSTIADSGAIDVGATTLDDIFSANPQDPAMTSLANVKAFTETRYNGTLGFSSGFGSRVNVSAPGDNINSLAKFNLAYDGVGLANTGGTSASSPEVAAAAAVALQVARLTGHPFASATQLRDALVATGTPVANAPGADVPLNVGPQVSVRRIVEQLLAASGNAAQPAIARVAVHGRRSGSYFALGSTKTVNDAVFVTALDPSYIKLDGSYTRMFRAPYVSFPGVDTGADLNSYITIAPDWEGIPAGAAYRLTVAGQPTKVVATTPYARLLPAKLFAASGVALTPGVSRTISLTYSASLGLHVLAESTFQLTFGPPAVASRLVMGPNVPPVISGSTIPVSYDLSGYPSALLNAPVLNVSLPGTGAANSPTGLYPYFSVPLTSAKGTVNVPTSALAGGGTYALWIDMQPGITAFTSDISDEAFVRVDTGTTRPPAPLLSPTGGGPAAHTLTVPYRNTFRVSYDVSNVPGATGAILEISAPPPSTSYYQGALPSSRNTFRNPNGSTVDDDGAVTGSIYHVQANGTTGSITIDPEGVSLPATASVNVRTIPTAGGTPIAEASDADSVTYLGIEPILGLPLMNLYLNPNGTDGFLAESGSVGTAQENIGLYTLESFDLGTGIASGFPLTFTSNQTQFFPIVQNDVGLAESALDQVTMNYYRAIPLAGGFSQFTFPPGTYGPSSVIESTGTNSSPTQSAYLGFDTSTGSFTAVRGDVTTGTFGAPVDVTALLGPNIDSQGLASVAYDPAGDRAYVLAEDATVACDQQSPQLITVDFATGTASARSLPIGGGDVQIGNQGYQMAIDPATHVMAVATSCPLNGASRGTYRAELSLVDLNTGQVSRVFQHSLSHEQFFHGFVALVGGDSATIGIDAVNHLILQRSMFCPQIVADVDLNARPCLNLYDESGRLVKTMRGLFSNGFSDGTVIFNGVNGSTRTGVAMGQQSDATVFITSFDVQPYHY
jgi:hypothetical protein